MNLQKHTLRYRQVMRWNRPPVYGYVFESDRLAKLGVAQLPFDLARVTYSTL